MNIFIFISIFLSSQEFLNDKPLNLDSLSLLYTANPALMERDYFLDDSILFYFYEGKTNNKLHYAEFPKEKMDKIFRWDKMRFKIVNDDFNYDHLLTKDFTYTCDLRSFYENHEIVMRWIYYRKYEKWKLKFVRVN